MNKIEKQGNSLIKTHCSFPLIKLTSTPVVFMFYFINARVFDGLHHWIFLE